MARKRDEAGIEVIGLSCFVKDPAAAATAFMSEYRYLPGMGSVTLPDPAPEVRSTILLRGAIQSSGFSEPGQITIPFGAASQHPTHRFLRDAHEDGRNFLLKLRKPAVKVGSIAAALGAGAVEVRVKGISKVDIVAAKQEEVSQLIVHNMIVSISNADPVGGDWAGDYDQAAGQAADDNKFQAVFELEEDGSELYLVPGFSAANTAAAIGLFVRTPGMEWADVTVKAGQMASGDWQPGDVVKGNLVIPLTRRLPNPSLVVTTSEE